jgi:hypothetical protein
MDDGALDGDSGEWQALGAATHIPTPATIAQTEYNPRDGDVIASLYLTLSALV